MAKTKTVWTKANVTDFINEFSNSDQKRKDSFELVKLMQEMTGHKPKMWGPSIVGFGSYHYKYESGHEGDAPMIGFSPRKAAISLYVYTGLKEHEHLLDGLGKFKIGKVCIYANKLSDIDMGQLKRIIKESLKYVKSNYETGV
jgi:hypothetical protein